MDAKITHIPRIFNAWIKDFVLSGVKCETIRKENIKKFHLDIQEMKIVNVSERKEGVTRDYYYYTEEIISDPIDVTAEKVGGYGITALNNLFPDYIKTIVNLSPMGSACLRVKKQFIFGRGVSEKSLANSRINEKGETLNELVEKIGNDLAYIHRFACLIIKKMVNGKLVISGIEHLPVEWIRLGIPDDLGYIDHVRYNPFFNTFQEIGNYQSRTYFFFTNNEDESTRNYLKHLSICENIQENYQFGEVYYYSESNEFNRTYSRPEYFSSGENLLLCDAAIWQAHERNAANNFFMGGILELTGDKDEIIRNPENDKIIGTREFVTQQQLSETFGGTKNAGAIMTFWSQTAGDNVKFTPFQPNNSDQLFKDIIPQVRDAIPTLMQVSPLLAGIATAGKLGDSKEKEGAIKFQNEKTEWGRIVIARFLNKLSSFFQNSELIEILPIQEQIEMPDFVWQTLTISEKRRYIQKNYDVELDEEQNEGITNQPGNA